MSETATSARLAESDVGLGSATAVPSPSSGTESATSEKQPRRDSLLLRRPTMLFAPPPEIYLNRTVITTPAGELSLEDLFHEVDANLDGKISAMHELPVALTCMGLYWDEELGIGLLSDRTGVDSLEVVLAIKCKVWWGDEPVVTQPDASTSDNAPGGGTETPVSAIVDARLGASTATSKLPPPPPPRYTLPENTSDTGLREVKMSKPGDGPVQDRSIDWTTFCTIVALLQACGAYKQVIRSAIRKKADIASVAASDPSAGMTVRKVKAGRKLARRRRRRSSFNDQVQELHSITGVHAVDEDEEDYEVEFAGERIRSRSDAEARFIPPLATLRTKSAKHRKSIESLPGILQRPADATFSPRLTDRSETRQPTSARISYVSSGSLDEISADQRASPNVTSRSLDSHANPDIAARAHDVHALRRMTTLLKSRNTFAQQPPYAIPQSSSDNRASRLSFTDIVQAAMNANGIGKRGSSRTPPSPKVKLSKNCGDELPPLPPRTPNPAGTPSHGAAPSSARGQTASSLPPMSPSPATAVGAIFRHSSLRRLTRSPSNALVLPAGMSPSSTSSTGTAATSPQVATLTPSSASQASATHPLLFVNEPTAMDHAKRPSKFNFDMVAIQEEDVTMQKQNEQRNSSRSTASNIGSKAGDFAAPTERVVIHTARTQGSALASPEAAPITSLSDDSSSIATSAADATRAPAHEVFLGGACNPTVWRKSVAIPVLEEAGLSYYNPQVDEWHPGLVLAEAKAKDEADVVFFVVGPETRAVASMIEVAELISSERPIVLVLQDVPKDAVMNGHTLHPDEIKDLNRGRAYLANVADRHGVTVYQSIEAGLKEVIIMIETRREQRQHLALSTTMEESDGEEDIADDVPTALPEISVDGQEIGGKAARPPHFARMSMVSAISSVSSLDVDDQEDISGIPQDATASVLAR